ncbi:MAG: tyrosine--tRNA ligase [Myxococcota bacterium]
MHVLDELAQRGFIAQTTGLDTLREALDAGPLTFYVGVDPTADSLHVGHSIPLMAAHLLQRAGHIPIIVFGGGTAMVGDPSGKTEMRAMLSTEQIAENIQGIKSQVGGLLTLDGTVGHARNNADWIAPLNYIDFLRRIGSLFSVNRMLAMEAYKQRLKTGLSFIEFNYQLLQAYDFLVLHQQYGCSLQVGGDDQWGNILAGTDLIRRIEGPEAAAHGLTLPLITTSSGAKMGKTAKGAVWLDAKRTAPFDFYQYWINIDDRDVGRMLKLFTTLPLPRIAELESLQGAQINKAKAELAWQITARIHGDAEADRARDAAAAMVAGAASDEMPTHTVETLDGLTLVAALADAGLCKSRGEARRMVQGGGVRVNGDKVQEDGPFLSDWLIEGEAVLRVGKKRVARLTLSA